MLLAPILVVFPIPEALSQEGILRLSDIIAAEDAEAAALEPVFQRELEELEDKLIFAFNSLNEIEDFEIQCFRETQNGSYFFRACDPAFLTKERQANSLAWRKGTEPLLTKSAIRLKFQEKLDQLDAAFSKMLREDNEMMEIADSLLSMKESARR